MAAAMTLLLATSSINAAETQWLGFLTDNFSYSAHKNGDNPQLNAKLALSDPSGLFFDNNANLAHEKVDHAFTSGYGWNLGPAQLRLSYHTWNPNFATSPGYQDEVTLKARYGQFHGLHRVLENRTVQEISTYQSLGPLNLNAAVGRAVPKQNSLGEKRYLSFSGVLQHFKIQGWIDHQYRAFSQRYSLEYRPRRNLALTMRVFEDGYQRHVTAETQVSRFPYTMTISMEGRSSVWADSDVYGKIALARPLGAFKIRTMVEERANGSVERGLYFDLPKVTF